MIRYPFQSIAILLVASVLILACNANKKPQPRPDDQEQEVVIDSIALASSYIDSARAIMHSWGDSLGVVQVPLDYLDMAFELDSSDPGLYLVYAECYLDSGIWHNDSSSLQLAEDNAFRALALDSDFCPAYNFIGGLYYSKSWGKDMQYLDYLRTAVACDTTRLDWAHVLSSGELLYGDKENGCRLLRMLVDKGFEQVQESDYEFWCE